MHAVRKRQPVPWHARVKPAVVGAAILAVWTSVSTVPLRSQAGISIVGRVADGVDGAPVSGAIVSVIADDGRKQLESSLSDSQGRFVIREISTWPVTLRASKSGFVAGTFGQRYVGDASVPLTATDAREALIVPVWPTAKIAGTIVDESGAPVAGVRVLALRLQLVAGRGRFVVRGTTASDDRGQYRLFELPSGSYLVALPQSPQDLVALTRYHPDTLLPQAARRFDLQPGAEQVGVDFSLRAVPGVSVRGSVMGLPAGREATIRVYHGAAGEPLVDMPIATAVVQTPGLFTLPRLPAGLYRLSVVSFPLSEPGKGTVRARQEGDGSGLTGVMPGRSLPLAPVSSEATLWAEHTFAVDAETVDLRVPVNRGARLRGRAIFEGDGQRPILAQLLSMPVVVQPADGRDLGSFQVSGLNVQGRFETIGLPPGKYIPFVFPALGWFQASISVGGVRQESDSVELGSGDIDDIELRLAGALPTLQGTVRGRDGRPVSRASVYIFPESATQWVDSGTVVFRMLECRSGSDGRYRRAGILPGRYLVAASAGGRGELWRDSGVLKLLRVGANSVDVRLGEAASMDPIIAVDRSPEREPARWD